MTRRVLAPRQKVCDCKYERYHDTDQSSIGVPNVDGLGLILSQEVTNFFQGVGGKFSRISIFFKILLMDNM